MRSCGSPQLAVETRHGDTDRWDGGIEAHGRDRRAEAGSPERDRGLFLHLAIAAEHRHGRDAQQGPRAQHLSHGASDVLECAGVRRGDEQHGEVGRVAERFEHMADDLTGGVRRHWMLRHRQPRKAWRSGLDWWQECVRNDDRIVDVDAAARFDGAVVLERELGAHEAVVELARLDREHLHVASHERRRRGCT